MTARRDKERDKDLVGKLVAGKYRVVKLLGQGGFGSVFLVEMVTGIVGDKLAMKILPREFSSDPTLREQFLNEIRVAMKMVNRYIVQIRDIGVTEDDLLYYTMDYVEGRSLAQVLRDGPISPVRAVRIVMRILKALVTAHAAEIIHRDLKPANIMVKEDGDKESARILDFGLATALSDETADRLAGSVHYMPPEQFLGSELGFYTDLYSVGVILYESLSGQKPYPGKTFQEVLRHLKQGSPTPVEELAPEVAKYPGLAAIVARAIEHNPARRFQSAREFFDGLNEVLAGRRAAEATASRRARRSVGRSAPRRWVTRPSSSGSPVAMIAVALVVLVLGAGVFAGAVRNHRDPDRNGETVEPEPVPPAAPWSPVVTPPPDGGEATVDVEPEVEPEVTVGRTEPPKRTAEAGVAELLKKARDAEKLANWNEVVRNANLAIDQGQSHPGALYLFAKGKYHVGEFRAAMEALEYIPVRELTADAARLLADAHLKLEIPNLLGARKVLGRARKAHPKDAEVAAALARLLMDVGERAMVRELVVDAKASGLEHAELDRLHEELVVKPRKERLAAFEELAKKAEEHFAAARYKQAIDTAEDAKKTRDTTCLSVLLVEAYTRVEKFDRADRALESLRRLLRDAKGRQKDCGFEQDPEVLGHWADYFAGRNAYLRYLRGGKKELLVRARADLDRLVARADARKHPDLVALARTYRGCVMARTVRNAQLALDALIKEFRSTVRNAQVEVIQAQAEAYVYVAGKAEVDDHVKIEKQEDELRREKAKMAENRRLAREARKRRQEKDYEDLSEAMEKNRQRIAGLEEALDAQKGLREFKTRALNKAMGRVSTWLSTKKRLKEAYYVAGRVYFEKGVVSGDAGMFRNAVNRLKESAKLGENSPALYDMLGKSYEYRGSFRLDAARSYLEAYRRGPSPDRCIRAADAFKAARNTPQALKVLEAGSKIFPGDAGIERMLERLRG